VQPLRWPCTTVVAALRADMTLHVKKENSFKSVRDVEVHVKKLENVVLTNGKAHDYDSENYQTCSGCGAFGPLDL